MRILLWHGWLLEGSGSNVATARVAEHYRAAGHDVLLLCQEQHPERYPWIDAFGAIGADGPSELTSQGVQAAPGRCVVLRPRIGSMVPRFVGDRDGGVAAGRRVRGGDVARRAGRARALRGAPTSDRLDDPRLRRRPVRGVRRGLSVRRPFG